MAKYGTNQSLEIEGMKPLLSRLRALGKEKKVATVLKAAVRTAGSQVRRSAISNLPTHPRAYFLMQRAGGGRFEKGELVGPGFVKRSVKTQVFLSKDKQAAKVLIGVHKKAWFAINFLEFGVPTRNIARHPWLIPALEANKQIAGRIVIDRVNQKIEQIIQKDGKGR